MYLKKLRTTYLLSSIGFTLMFALIIIINLLNLSHIDIPDPIPSLNNAFSYIGYLCVAAGMIMGLAAPQLSDMKPAFGCLLAMSVLMLILRLGYDFMLFDGLGSSVMARAFILDFIWLASYIAGGVGCLLLYRSSKPMIISVIGFGVLVLGSLLFTYIDFEVMSMTDAGFDLWSAWQSMETICEIALTFYVLGMIGACVGWWVSFASVGKENHSYSAVPASSGPRRGTVPLANRNRRAAGAKVVPSAFNPVADNGGYGVYGQQFDFGNQSQPQPAQAVAEPLSGLKSASDSELMSMLRDTTDRYSVEEQEEASMILFDRGSELLFGELRRYTPEQISEIANNPDEYFKGYVRAAKSLMK